MSSRERRKPEKSYEGTALFDAWTRCRRTLLACIALGATAVSYADGIAFEVYAIYVTPAGEVASIRPENLPRGTRNQATLAAMASTCTGNDRACTPNPEQCEVIAKRQDPSQLPESNPAYGNEHVPGGNAQSFYTITSIRYYGYNVEQENPQEYVLLSIGSPVDVPVSEYRSYMCRQDEITTWRDQLLVHSPARGTLLASADAGFTLAISYPYWCYVRSGGTVYIRPECTRR